MKNSLQSCLRANLLFCLGLLHWGEARVLTEAQAGPLYRVVGSPLSISCNVSGFANDGARKEIEFRIKKPSQPTFDINIIRTSDDSFGYAVYTRRVRSKEITLTHVTPNSVLFEIQRLEKDDEGEYDCTVINPEYVYDGTYSAKTTVKVIDNSLSVSSPASVSLSHDEGDALTLTCQASSNTVQHTHLSLVWYLHKDDEDNAQPIISLDRDFILSPGPGFEGRYQAGLIRLDKMGEATYKLNMAQLERSDQGKIYCQAQEWIQDPDRTWYAIAQKEGEETTLHVKTREVVSDTTSLVVRISAQSETLQEGQELSLSCNVDTQNLEERFFSVAWLRGSDELVRIGPTGILSAGPEYGGRVKDGELRATRTGDRDYRLILRPVRTEDQGEYICRAWLQDRDQNGAFTRGTAQDSGSLLIRISTTESGLSVEMRNTVGVNEGDRLELTCKVHGVKGQLSVTWLRKSTSASTATFTSVVSLSQEGVVQKEGEFTGRDVKATRPAADTFTLELDEVTPADSGVYQCAVSEWKINSKTSSQSQTATVTVAPADSFMTVSLISRDSVVTVGGRVELMCRVRGPRVPITLTWSLQRDASTIDNILTLYSDGAISWPPGDQHSYQLKVENKQKEVVHYLLINGISHREAGTYQCRASVFQKKLPPSNQLALSVENPVSKLLLTAAAALMRNINTDIEIKCNVISEPSASSRYAVTWLLRQRAENTTFELVSSDSDALVTFGPRVQPSHGQRISVRRTKGPGFELIVRQAQISDSGSYTCMVEEWLRDPHDNWYQLSPVSKTTELTVIEPANDLRLNKNEPTLSAREGDEVELKCNIISGASVPFFYKVAWLYAGHDSAIAKPLVELDHTGLLSYPENQELGGLRARLRLSRPTQDTFYLGIQRAHEGDGGTYRCQVEQYQLDHEGHWLQKASDSAGPITLTVNVAEKKLSIMKEENTLNISRSQDFSIPCHITNQSGSESEFQVSWFWRNERETERHPVFTANRDSTLQDRFGKSDRLRFAHPLPNQYSLTVSKPSPEDSGLYFCEVEEWLPSPSRGWRKVAVEKSGYLTVNVHAEGVRVSEPESKLDVWMVSFIATVICSLLVTFLLVLMIRRSKVSQGNKPGQSLWAEQHPLNSKPSADPLPEVEGRGQML